MTTKPESKNSLKTLKYRNRKLVLSFMRSAGAVSVNEISCVTNLSKMTVHKIIDHYLEEGMIAHVGKGVSTEEGGKKPNLFAFNAHCRFIYAVRLGGGFLSTRIVNLKGETIVERKTIPIGDISFDDVIKLIADVFQEQVRDNNLPRDQCLAAVIGANGLIDVERGVCLAAFQFPHWGKNIPIRDALAARLPENVPVHVDSWWRHLAHGEMYFSENGDRRRFFLIGNSGDYLSGGLVADGRVCHGKNGFAGEIGHMIIAPESGAKCRCGGVGCLEAVATPGAIWKGAVARRDQYPASALFARNPIGSLVDVGEAADAGDELGLLLLDKLAGYFAIAVNNIVQICDPGHVVFFGDYAQCGDYFYHALRQRLDALCLHGLDNRTLVEPSALCEDHGVVGAANHMTDTLFSAGR